MRFEGFLLFRGRAHVGMELPPHETFLALDTDNPSQPYMIGVKRHAEVRELLVSEGETVRPGQPLAVVEEREPTSEEYDELLKGYWERGRQLQDQRAQLRSLGGVLRLWFGQRRGGKERRPEVAGGLKAIVRLARETPETLQTCIPYDRTHGRWRPREGRLGTRGARG